MTVAPRRFLAAAMVAIAWAGSATVPAAPKLRYVASVYAGVEQAALHRPQAVACGRGTVAVGDDDGRIVLFDVQERTLVPRAQVALPELTSPVRLAFEPGGGLLALDGRSRRIVRISPAGESGGFVTVPAGPDGSSPIPRALAVDREGRIHVLDAASGSVVAIDAAGAATRRIALPAEGSHSDLAVLADGTVLILDPAQARLLRAAPGETQATAWASLRERAEFPVALATDPAGRLVVLDRHGGGVVIVHPDGAAEARQIDAGWREGELRYPSGLCLDEVGRLFVADTDNGRVQMFQLAP